MPNHSKERDQAEARFKKAQKATQDAKQATADYESEARTVREKTARLKALRLAKEVVPFLCRWRSGDWKNVETGERIEAVVKAGEHTLTANAYRSKK